MKKDSTMLEGPQRIQIQTRTGCNGRCVFCPNEEVMKSGLPRGDMPEELFHKIIDELAETNPRRISLYLMNEPLNDPRLEDLTAYAADRVPEASTLVTSNGVNLLPERTEGLIRAGLKRLKVSLQSLDPKTNEALMGYDCAPVVQNVLDAHQVIRRMGAKGFDLRVSMVVTAQNAREIDQDRRFWKKHGIRLVTSSLENRGGNIAGAEAMNVGAMAVRRDCIRPSREMCVLFNGDVVLCCVDWYRTVVVGNLARQSIREVWNGEPLQRIREAFRQSSGKNLPPICANCTESACPNTHRRGWLGFLRRRSSAASPR